MPFLAFAILVLRHFYVLGAFWGDSGLIAYVMAHGGPLLHLPLVLGGGSYFGTHFTLVFVPLTLLAQTLPLSAVQFFALFSGVCAALPAVAVYWLLVSSYRLAAVPALGLSLAFAFNGLILAAARNPHFEMLAVGAGMMFFAALLQKRFVIATACFTLCLATREDAGFDLFALLFITCAIGWRRGLPWVKQKPLVLYGVLAFLYSAVAVVAQHLCFASNGAFVSVYLGTPAFGTLSWAEIGTRLEFLFRYRLYIVLPAYVAVIWGIRARNPSIYAGYLAFVPWGVLNLLAASPIAGTLSNYYSFPFVFALFWPLVGLLLQGGTPGRPGVAGFALMLLASFTDIGAQHNPGGINLPASFFSVPSLQRQRATDAALLALARAAPGLGRVVADGSVAALAPDDFAPAQLVASPQQTPPDTVIYFARGYDSADAIALATRAGLRLDYAIADTNLRIATDRPLRGLAGSGAMKPAGDGGETGD